MKKSSIISLLRRHQAELRDAGILHLALFGSLARDEGNAGSDVDLVAVFDEAHQLSLLDILLLQRRLSNMLGATVDLVEENALKPKVRASVELEAVRAF